MDWVSYTAIVVIAVVCVFVFFLASGFDKARKERQETWQRLSEAFDGVTVRRVMNVAPVGSADSLVYEGTPYLGTFELTNDVLRFYRFKLKNGSIVEFPIDRIVESSRINEQDEPAVTLKIESSEGKQIAIVANVPEQLCARLARLGNTVEADPL